MRPPQPGGRMTISTRILKSAQKSIQKLFLDDNLTASIQYKLFSGSTFSDSLGFTESVYITYELTAIRTERNRYSISAPGEMGAIQGVEINFLVQELPDDYSNRDLIQHNDTNYQIERISKIAELAYKIQVIGA